MFAQDVEAPEWVKEWVADWPSNEVEAPTWVKDWVKQYQPGGSSFLSKIPTWMQISGAALAGILLFGKPKRKRSRKR